MKLFIYRIALFLLPFALIAYPLDLIISKYLSKSKQFPGELEVMKDIYEGNIDSDVAIYGSSRAWVHIDPSIIQDSLGKSAYNFGIDGHHFWMQYLRHLEYLKYNRKPTHIILSLDIFSLEIRNDLYGLEQFLPYMLWNKNIRNYTTRYKGFSTMDYYLPLVRYIGNRNAIISAYENMTQNEDAPAFRKRGFRGMDKTWNSDLKDAKAKMGEYRVKLHKPSVELFRRFIRECRSLDITLILVCSPEYVEGQKFVTNRNQIIHFYHQIAEINKLLFLDFSSNPICLNRDMFYNSLHLNKTGAHRFTKQLVGRLGSLN